MLLLEYFKDFHGYKVSNCGRVIQGGGLRIGCGNGYSFSPRPGYNLESDI